MSLLLNWLHEPFDHKVKRGLYFFSSFRFRAKFRGRYRDFWNIHLLPYSAMGLQMAIAVKNPHASAEDAKTRFNSWVRKIPWEENDYPLQCSIWRIPWRKEPGGLKIWTLKYILGMSLNIISYLLFLCVFCKKSNISSKNKYY